MKESGKQNVHTRTIIYMSTFRGNEENSDWIAECESKDMKMREISGTVNLNWHH